MDTQQHETNFRLSFTLSGWRAGAVWVVTLIAFFLSLLLHGHFFVVILATAFAFFVTLLVMAVLEGDIKTGDAAELDMDEGDE